MNDFTECHPELMFEKANIADNAGDSEKAALYLTIAQLLEIVESQDDEISDLKNDIKKMPDYAEYVEFFNDCFVRLDGRYPCPSITSDYDKSVIFNAIDKGEAE